MFKYRMPLSMLGFSGAKLRQRGCMEAAETGGAPLYLQDSALLLRDFLLLPAAGWRRATGEREREHSSTAERAAERTQKRKCATVKKSATYYNVTILRCINVKVPHLTSLEAKNRRMTWFIACLCDNIRTEVFVLRTVAALQYVAHYLCVAHFLFGVRTRPAIPCFSLLVSSCHLDLLRHSAAFIKRSSSRCGVMNSKLKLPCSATTLPYCHREALPKLFVAVAVL